MAGNLLVRYLCSHKVQKPAVRVTPRNFFCLLGFSYGRSSIEVTLFSNSAFALAHPYFESIYSTSNVICLPCLQICHNKRSCFRCHLPYAAVHIEGRLNARVLTQLVHSQFVCFRLGYRQYHLLPLAFPFSLESNAFNHDLQSERDQGVNGF